MAAFQVTAEADEKRLYAAAIATFCLILGREICMDIKDRPGDMISFMHKFGSTRMAIVGFSLQLVGLFSLATQVTQKGHVFALSAMLCILVLSGIYWFRLSRYWLAIIVMKVQWVVGLYFLL